MARTVQTGPPGPGPIFAFSSLPLFFPPKQIEFVRWFKSSPRNQKIFSFRNFRERRNAL
jgi:hypothetical protein